MRIQPTVWRATPGTTMVRAKAQIAPITSRTMPSRTVMSGLLQVRRRALEDAPQESGTRRDLRPILTARRVERIIG